MKKGEITQSIILYKTYQLLFTYNWEQITIEDIEKAIGKTRGAIFHSYKNKQELFQAIIKSHFLSLLDLSPSEKEQITSYSNFYDLYTNYQTPFDRIKNNIQTEFNQKEPQNALLNIVLQASKHYPNFDSIVMESIEKEMRFLERVISRYNVDSAETISKALFILSFGILLLEKWCSTKDLAYDCISDIASLLSESKPTIPQEAKNQKKMPYITARN